MTLALAMPVDFIRDVIATVVRDDDDIATTELKAVLQNLIFGISEPLRRATSDDEILAVVDALATVPLLERVVELTTHPAFERLMRPAHAASLRPPRYLDREVAELVDDIGERYLSLARPLATYRSDRAANDKLVGRLVARIFVDQIGIASAAYGDVRWPAARPRLLWNDAVHSLWSLAGACGFTWEQATDVLTSSRDRRLLTTPYDQKQSDEAATLLGLR